LFTPANPGKSRQPYRKNLFLLNKFIYLQANVAAGNGIDDMRRLNYTPMGYMMRGQ
jgi:hypothetical protein